MAKTGVRIRLKGHEKEYGLEEIDVIVDAVGAEKKADDGGGLLGGGSSMLLMALLLGAGGSPSAQSRRGPLGPGESIGTRVAGVDCECYGLASSHAPDCPAWSNGRAARERVELERLALERGQDANTIEALIAEVVAAGESPN